MNFDCVLPNLYVGSDPRDPEDFRKLKSAGVTAILGLQCDDERANGGIERERADANEAGLLFHGIPVMDFDTRCLERKLPDCVEALDSMLKQGQNVYIHCTAGTTRSPTVAAAYLHRRMGWPLQKSLAHLRTVRQCTPNWQAIRRVPWAG